MTSALPFAGCFAVGHQWALRATHSPKPNHWDPGTSSKLNRSIRVTGFVMPRSKLNLVGCSVLYAILAQTAATQQPLATSDVDWPMYRHDSAGTGYSTLSQINTRNVGTL